ncbi:hypothetical protein [Actinoplanes siamensis]|uniref:Uncharacterized protein n=1 Tax=Actinoplanes siamensis TaxID=1223317 RepID=A0A919TQA7_9ACTN|nr:hypothetical protein [Actinoplanes siamensis]GIF09655.1 hypothetical protein Asi03nite_71930 [Actinoplanes siamensis]
MNRPSAGVRNFSRRITDRYPDDPPTAPAKSTFNKLLRTMTTGAYTFDNAVTRRNMNNRPAGGFTTLTFARPGQVVQIDTTTIDVLTHLGDGVAERGELTAAIDVATRTLCAGVPRTQGTKAVDAALLLPRMLVPDPMRPGWPASADSSTKSAIWKPNGPRKPSSASPPRTRPSSSASGNSPSTTAPSTNASKPPAPTCASKTAASPTSKRKSPTRQ